MVCPLVDEPLGEDVEYNGDAESDAEALETFDEYALECSLLLREGSQ